ncbi:MAG: CRISPR-associated protein Cas4 [Acidobacteriota bacterium]
MTALPVFTGTELGYYFICHKKLWWFTHGVQMEQGNERVKIGKLVHETAYARKKKELEIDNKIVIDWQEDGIIHETKLTDKMETAHEMQLLYYLYYLKLKGVENLRGEIDYPKLRRKHPVELTPENEARVKAALDDMQRITDGKRPPEVKWMKICRSCSYAELCWG